LTSSFPQHLIAPPSHILTIFSAIFFPQPSHHIDSHQHSKPLGSYVMWSRPFQAPALRWATGGSRTLATRFPAPGRGPRNSLRRKEFPQPISSHRNRSSPDNASSGQLSSNSENLSATLHDTNPEHNSLLSPVHIPEDPNAVLKERHPAAKLLANSGLVIQRQLELMNVML
jgi:hypothetical protein